MLSRYRLFFSLVFVLSFLRAFATTPVVAWEGSFDHQLDDQAETLPTGQAVMRLRYRGETGDVVWCQLYGAVLGGEAGERAPLRNIVLEYDASGGHGEWETAEAVEGGMGCEFRAPAKGLVEFRVRAKTAGITEKFTLDFGGDTSGSKPLCFAAAIFKGSLSPGYNKLYPLNVLRGNSTYEFEVSTDGFTPWMDLLDPHGNGFAHTPRGSGPTYEAQGFLARIEGKYQLKISARNGKSGGNFTLRTWYPVTLKRRQ
jgi:hypothetical protein